MFGAKMETSAIYGQDAGVVSLLAGIMMVGAAAVRVWRVACVLIVRSE